MAGRPWNTPVEVRFWEKVNKTDGCWLWTGAKRGPWYGGFVWDGEVVMAHRASWEMANGPIPEGALVLHHCDVPRCVRPGHLFLGTHADNTADMVAKGRAPGGGRGSVYRRSVDGRWVAAIRMSGGRRKAFYGATREEVEGKVAPLLKRRLARQLKAIRVAVLAP